MKSSTYFFHVKTQMLPNFQICISVPLTNESTNVLSFCTDGYVMLCAIWYHLYNLKSVKNTHGGVLLLVKLQVLFSLQLYQK